MADRKERALAYGALYLDAGETLEYAFQQLQELEESSDAGVAIIFDVIYGPDEQEAAEGVAELLNAHGKRNDLPLKVYTVFAESPTDNPRRSFQDMLGPDTDWSIIDGTDVERVARGDMEEATGAIGPRFDPRKPKRRAHERRIRASAQGEAGPDGIPDPTLAGLPSEKLKRGDFEQSKIEGVTEAHEIMLEAAKATQTKRFPSALAALIDNLLNHDANPDAPTEQECLDYGVRCAEQTFEELTEKTEVVYVGDEMCELLDYVEPDFKQEALHFSDLLVPFGLAAFASPRQFTARGGEMVEYSVLLWAASLDAEARKDPEPGVVIIGLAKVDLDDGLDLGPIWTPVFIGGAAVDTEFDTEARSAAFLDVRRTFQVLQRLCAQKIVVESEGHVERHSRRRGQRAGFKNAGRVRVVTLRREKGQLPPDHVPGDVEWSHRWIVKPFWRNQWYPSLGIHRQILVGPYIKGPEGLPLKLPQKRGFALVR